MLLLAQHQPSVSLEKCGRIDGNREAHWHACWGHWQAYSFKANVLQNVFDWSEQFRLDNPVLLKMFLHLKYSFRSVSEHSLLSWSIVGYLMLICLAPYTRKPHLCAWGEKKPWWGNYAKTLFKIIAVSWLNLTSLDWGHSVK